jgi:hypothetical protein
MKQLSAILLGVLLAGGACGKGGSSGPKTKTVDLGTTGYVVDVPDDWKLDVPMDGFFDFDGRGSTPQIMTMPTKVNTPDELATSRCEGRKDIKKETLPGGGSFVACTGESKMVKGVTTTQVVAEIPKGDEKFVCHLETDKDVDVVSKVCKSLRKKS